MFLNDRTKRSDEDFSKLSRQNSKLLEPDFDLNVKIYPEKNNNLNLTDKSSIADPKRKYSDAKNRKHQFEDEGDSNIALISINEINKDSKEKQITNLRETKTVSKQRNPSVRKSAKRHTKIDSIIISKIN